MTYVDVTGRAVTAGSAAAGRCWDSVVEGWLEFAPDLAARIDRALEVDPGMPAALTLQAWLLHGTHDPSTDSARDAALAMASRHAAEASLSERMHLEAVRAGIAGDHAGAAATWERVLDADRRDLMALRCAYFHHYEQGRTESTCRIAMRSLGVWPTGDRWLPFVEGMAAFALSELDEVDAAERVGRKAAEAAPQDLWALHAVVHVLEDGARPAEGSRWISRHEDHLPVTVGFARHVWWHGALFALAMHDFNQALDVFDGAVTAGGTGGHLDLTNAISLLARLELAGVDVGDRWDAVVAAARERVSDHRSLFVHCHLALASAWGGGDPDSVRSSTRAWARTDPLVRKLGVPLVDAVLQWSPIDAAPRRATPPVSALLGQLGGSRAQRRLFTAVV